MLLWTEKCEAVQGSSPRERSKLLDSLSWSLDIHERSKPKSWHLCWIREAWPTPTLRLTCYQHRHGQICSCRWENEYGKSPGNWHAQKQILLFHQLVGIYWIHSSVCKKYAIQQQYHFLAITPVLWPAHCLPAKLHPALCFLEPPSYLKEVDRRLPWKRMGWQIKGGMGNKKSESPQLVIHASEQNAQKGQLAGSRRAAWKEGIPNHPAVRKV